MKPVISDVATRSTRERVAGLGVTADRWESSLGQSSRAVQWQHWTAFFVAQRSWQTPSPGDRPQLSIAM